MEDKIIAFFERLLDEGINICNESLDINQHTVTCVSTIGNKQLIFTTEHVKEVAETAKEHPSYLWVLESAGKPIVVGCGSYAADVSDYNIISAFISVMEDIEDILIKPQILSDLVTAINESEHCADEVMLCLIVDNFSGGANSVSTELLPTGFYKAGWWPSCIFEDGKLTEPYRVYEKGSQHNVIVRYNHD
jgi:hypothetical protein